MRYRAGALRLRPGSLAGGRASVGGRTASPDSRGRSVRRSLRGLRGDQEQDDRRDDQAVDDERRVVVTARPRRAGRRWQAGRPPAPPACRRRTGLPALREISEEHVVDTAIDDRSERGRSEEEGESRSGVAVELHETACSDRDTRARHAWHESEALGETHDHCPRPRSPIPTRCRLRSARQRRDPEGREEDRDLPRLTEVVGEDGLERGPDDQRRNRRDDDEPDDPPLRSAIRRLRIERPSAARRASMSCQKYATTATVVPRCSATSNVWLNSSCVSRYVQLRARAGE